MQLDGRCFYEEPLRGKRIFHSRKSSLWPAVLTVCALLFLLFETVSRF